MPSTYTTNNGLEKIGTGEQSGTWGDTTNLNFDILDQALDGLVTITATDTGSSGSPNTLPITDGSLSDGRNRLIIITDGGDLGGSVYYQLTPADAEKIVFLRNSLSGSRDLILFQGAYNAARDLIVPAGKDVIVKFSGTGTSTAVVAPVFADLSLDAATIASADINGGTIDGVTIGVTSVATVINVDNLKLDGNTLSSTDTNGNVVLAPNGDGDVQLDADTVRVGDNNNDVTITTNGTGDLTLNTNGGTNSGSIEIQDGVNTNIIVTANGTGKLELANGDITTSASSGSDAAGQDLTIQAGASTGNAAGGDMIFQTTPAGAGSGTNLNSYTTVLTLTDDSKMQIGTSTAVDSILDEDDMTSDSATALATQQSIKAYVDSQVGTVDTLAEILANGNTTGGTNIQMTTTDELQFRDTGLKISSSADGQLDIDSDGTIDINATTSIAFDTDTLFVDSANDRVGVGTSSVDSLFHVAGSSTVGTVFTLEQTDTTLVTDQAVGVFNFKQNDAGSTAGVAAKFGAFADGNSGEVGLRLYTGSGNTTTEAMRIDSSQRVMIGVTSNISVVNASLQFEVIGDTTDSGAGSLAVARFGGGSTIALGGSPRSTTTGSYVIVQDDDNLGNIFFGGDDGTDLRSVAARISADVDGTPGADDMPGRLVFYTTSSGTASTERMRIGSTGKVTIQTPASGTALEVNIIDNTADGFVVQQGSNEYISVDTTNSSEEVILGNATTNPSVIVKGTNLNINSAYIDFSGSISTPSTAAAIYRPADNTLAFSTANTEAMRINVDQKVIIGNTSTRGTYGLTVAEPSDGVRIFGIASGGMDALHLDQARGSVASPTASNVDGDGSYLSFSSYDGTNFDDIGSLAVVTDGAQDSGRMIFRTTPTGGSQVERMRINNSGDVTIGNAADARARLEVYDSGVSAVYDAGDLSTWRVMQVRNNIESFTGTAAGIAFGGDGSGDTETAGIVGISDNSTGGIMQLAFITATGNNSLEAMRIDSSQRVLIGSTSATNSVTPLNLKGSAGGVSGNNFVAAKHGNDNYQPAYTTARSRGSEASPTSVLVNDGIAAYNSYGYDGSSYIYTGGIQMFVDGDSGTNDMPSRLSLYTTSDGAASATERMRITNEGVIGIRDTTPFVNVPLNIGGMSSENALGGPTPGNNLLVGARISLYAGNQDHQLYMGANGWEMCGNSISRFAYKSGTNANNGDAVATIKWGISGTGRWLFGTETDISGDGAGALGIVQSDGGARMAIRGTSSTVDGNVGMLAMTNTSYANTGGGIHYLACRRANSSAWTFSGFYSTSNGSNDREFNFRGDGNGYADGSWNGGGADYAEYFEWSDGNSSAEDRRGMTVVLVENKIRVATSDDPTSSIIGVVSAAPVVVGDAAWNHWSERYLRDEFGSYQRETYTLTEWDGEVMRTETNPDGSEYQKLRTERLSYHTDQIPSDVTPPSDAVVVSVDGKGNTLTRRVPNPDYDPTRTYVPREDRPEWDAVGMVGKLRIRVGQPIGDRWIKLRDISANVEEWLIR